LLLVYRGKHCPICKSYLTELNGMLDDFPAINVDAIAVSADPKEKATASANDIGYNGTIGYDLSIAQMAQLGAYVSDPAALRKPTAPPQSPPLS
jgi:peroxiredoxin